jgi:hypothetical protein
MPASPVTLAIEPVSDTAAGVPRSESRTGLKSLTLLMLVVVDAELFAAEGETGRTSCALPVRCRAPRLMPTLQILLARTCHFAPRRPHVDGDEGDFAGSSSAAGPPQSHSTLTATCGERSSTCDASAMSIVFQAMNRTFHTEVCPRCRAGSARIAHQNLVFYCEDCGHSWLDVITSPQADRRESSMADRRRTSRTDRRKRNERAGTIADVES